MSFLFDSNKSKVDFDAAITPKLNALKDTFQGYVNSMYNALVGKGKTPTAKTPIAISTAITNIFDEIYTKFVNQGTTPSAKTVIEMSHAVDSLATAKYNAGVSDTKKGNAGQGDVLSGKTFTHSTKVNDTGTMVNRGAVSQTLNPNGSYTIPQGYHNGSGKVTAKGIQNATVNDSSFNWALDLNTGRTWTATYNTNHSTCFAAQVGITAAEEGMVSLSINISSGKIIVTVAVERQANHPTINAKYFYY